MTIEYHTIWVKTKTHATNIPFELYGDIDLSKKNNPIIINIKNRYLEYLKQNNIKILYPVKIFIYNGKDELESEFCFEGM